MWRAIVLSPLVVLATGSPGASAAETPAGVEAMFARPLAARSVAYDYLGYSGVILRLPAGTVVIDPGDLLTAEEMKALQAAKVTAVLYTHGHGDHFRPDVARILAEQAGATIIAEASVAQSLQDLPAGKVIAAQPGKAVTLGGLTIRSVPGVHRGAIVLYQVKGGGVSVFHAGDSGPVPLAAYRSDVAFLPVGTPSPTASPENALRMVRDLKPQVVVPVHGTAAQVADFQAGVQARKRGAQVVIPREHLVATLTLR